MNLFTAQGANSSHVIDKVMPRVMNDDNVILIAPFTQEQFRKALFDMDPDKAPGPDGSNLGFYQKLWSKIGGDEANACQSWLQY